MNTPDTAAADRNFQKNAMASFVQIGALFLLVFWCFSIIAPFVSIVIWALIIAIALHPLHATLTAKLGGREKLSATIFVLVLLSILLIPTISLTGSSVDALKTVSTELKDGSVTIPPPNASVADWPLIGERLFKGWSDAAANVQTVLNKFQPQLIAIGEWLLRSAGSTMLGVLAFVVSIIVAGVFLVSAEAGYRIAIKLSSALLGERGVSLTNLSVETIRSVAKGVLGVAVIQALLSAIGLVLIGVPAAGIWAGIILVLAIMQLPPLIVLGPIAVWVFSVAEPMPATIFGVYALIVSASDSFLKPMFLGRGMQIPMLVILLGAIGGMMLSGIVGLFLGAVVLALGYEILIAWMETDELNNPREVEGESEAEPA
ncbi:MAG: AI-2E family transporter [Woeseiaceae bacterium]